MNAQRLSRLIQPHHLTTLLIVSFAVLVVAFGLRAGAAQSRQDGAESSAPDEREFKNTIPAHVPIKVKLRNEQSFRKKENKNWARELEIEIKNTGAKPIYYVYVMFVLRDFVSGDGNPAAFLVKYGRPELAFLETPLEPGDVPILPGESVTLKLREGQVKGYEQRRDREGRDDARRVEFHLQVINFGDGTGFRGTEGEPDKAVRKSSAAPGREEQPGGLCPPAAASRSSSPPGGLLRALYTLTPASLSRVNFSPAETSPASPAAQITGGCNNCQTGTDICMWGVRDLTRHCHCDPGDPEQMFPTVYPAGSCDNPSGRCLRTETVNPTCNTVSGPVDCPHQREIGTCAVGDPTPTPTPTPTLTPTATPTPDPNATPTAPQPNPTNCFSHILPLPGAQPVWLCLCALDDDGTPADYPRHGPTGCPPNTFNNGRDCCLCQFETMSCPDGFTWNRTSCACLQTPAPPPPSGGGGSCAYAADENPWLDGSGCELCWDGVDNDCDGLTDGQEAGCWNRCNSPILIDTDGDGFDLTSAAGGVLFDFDGDGTRERLSWTARGADDAWLALDRNGNGAVDDARELFGNLTAQPRPPAGVGRNGFLALSEYDKAASGGNGDGAIDSRDSVFASLRLWRDANHDGLSAPDELHAPASLGVVRLHLAYKESKRVDAHGNRFRYRAKVDDAKGLKVNRWAWDVFLVRGQ